MANSLYVAAVEPYSGKIIVSLGIMSALIKTTARLGFFRPIARPYQLAGTDTLVPDRDVHLIRSVFRLDFEESEMFGMPATEAESLLAKADDYELLTIKVEIAKQSLQESILWRDRLSRQIRLLQSPTVSILGSD